jgi:geranylgeranyl diphosphate synthase type I
VSRAEAPAPAHPADHSLVQRIDAELADYLTLRRAEAAAVHPSVAEAAAALVEFVLGGGKRIRPTFAWWGWRGAGGDPDDEFAAEVLRAVSACELVQANALIHDDVMDASASRRGHPTVHVAFANRHRAGGWRGEPERFGAAAAILIGDLAMTWADDMLADVRLPRHLAKPVRRVWAAMRTEMLCGQYLDVWSQASGDDTAHTALRVDRFKTAAYTVERPLQLGAALAGAGSEVVSAYRRFGAEVGVAFQLRDDLLGVFGDPEVTGKPAGDDLREGKRTLLLALAVNAAKEHGDQAALGLLGTAVGDPELDEDRVERVREVLRRLGVPDELERRIDRLTTSALDALAGVDLTPAAAAALPQLARAATRRRA